MIYLHNYNRLAVYQKSMLLSKELIPLVKGKLPFELTNHLIKTVISIPSNIAEGSRKGSNKDFVKFLRVAYGSTAELITQLTIAQSSLPELTENLQSITSQTEEVERMIHGLIKKLQNS